MGPRNVTPILYREHWRHVHLHWTPRAWADTQRDGTRGKERLVTEYAMTHPNTATGQDDFVSRILWALSDPGGLPAPRFAELHPVPYLDWLEPFREDRFGFAGLLLFGAPPKRWANDELVSSPMRRPAPYDLAPQMALANWGVQEGRLDEVVRRICGCRRLAQWLRPR